MTPWKFAAADLLWVVVYAVLMLGITAALWYARTAALASFSAAQSQGDWEEWREAVREGETNAGTVQRKVPKSAEPPTLVLLRDHFGGCLATLLVFSSLLYAALAFMIRGVLLSPAPKLLTDVPTHPAG